jgi:hypothetical protein
MPTALWSRNITSQETCYTPATRINHVTLFMGNNKRDLTPAVTRNRYRFAYDRAAKLNISRTGLISFASKMNRLKYYYTLWKYFILWKDCAKVLALHVTGNVHLYHSLDSIFSHSTKLLGSIHAINFFLSFMYSLLVLYFTLVASKFAYTTQSTVANTDANKFLRMLREFAASVKLQTIQNIM